MENIKSLNNEKTSLPEITRLENDNVELDSHPGIFIIKGFFYDDIENSLDTKENKSEDNNESSEIHDIPNFI